MVRICFVCLGNICRSPTAEGVMAAVVDEAGLAATIEIDSAGTGGWHVGQPPDERATEEAARRGIDLTSLRARQVHPGDFEWFDLLVAMDEQNLADLADLAPDGHLRTKTVLLGEFHPEGHRPEVPDPYYGGPNGFVDVFDLVRACCEGLLEHLQSTEQILDDA